MTESTINSNISAFTISVNVFTSNLPPQKRSLESAKHKSTAGFIYKIFLISEGGVHWGGEGGGGGG